MATLGQHISTLLKRILFLDFLKGLRVTLGYNVSKAISERYPDEEKWIPYQRFRGIHTLNRDEEGRELCVACELCSKICPTDCILVIPEEDDTGRGIADRVPKVWDVDLSRCLFCGYCEDACPTTAVRMGREYEMASYTVEETVLHKETLLVPPPVPESFKGGVLAKAKLIRDKVRLKVKADLSNIKQRRH